MKDLRFLAAAVVEDEPPQLPPRYVLRRYGLHVKQVLALQPLHPRQQQVAMVALPHSASGLPEGAECCPLDRSPRRLQATHLVQPF